MSSRETGCIKRRLRVGAAELVFAVGDGQSIHLLPSCVFDTTIQNAMATLAFATETPSVVRATRDASTATTTRSGSSFLAAQSR